MERRVDIQKKLIYLFLIVKIISTAAEGGRLKDTNKITLAPKRTISTNDWQKLSAFQKSSKLPTSPCALLGVTCPVLAAAGRGLIGVDAPVGVTPWKSSPNEPKGSGPPKPSEEGAESLPVAEVEEAEKGSAPLWSKPKMEPLACGGVALVVGDTIAKGSL